MAAITLSSGVRQNLASLQSTSALQTLTQNRLATGKKVNSALDNPTSFFTASGLSNRASDLTNLLDNMGQGVKTLEAADKGMKAITKLVENAQSIAKQAQAAPEDSVKDKSMLRSGALASDFAATGGSFQINLGGTAQAVTIAASDDAADVATAIQTAGRAAGDATS